jgi:hypothetical protein
MDIDQEHPGGILRMDRRLGESGPSPRAPRGFYEISKGILIASDVYLLREVSQTYEQNG